MSSDVVLKASQTMASRPSFYGLGFGVGPEVPGLGLGLEVPGLGLGLERCIDTFLVGLSPSNSKTENYTVSRKKLPPKYV